MVLASQARTRLLDCHAHGKIAAAINDLGRKNCQPQTWLTSVLLVLVPGVFQILAKRQGTSPQTIKRSIQNPLGELMYHLVVPLELDTLSNRMRVLQHVCSAQRGQHYPSD